jgi:hypothetical protein
MVDLTLGCHLDNDHKSPYTFCNQPVVVNCSPYTWCRHICIFKGYVSTVVTSYNVKVCDVIHEDNQPSFSKGEMTQEVHFLPFLEDLLINSITVL